MRKRAAITLFILTLCGAAVVAQFNGRVRVGRQPSGSFIVATGQSVLPASVSFNGRPMDIALHPSGEFFAVLNQGNVFLASRAGIVPGSLCRTSAPASYRGCIWTPSGSHLFISTSRGYLERFRLENRRLISDSNISLVPSGTLANPVPGGMDIDRQGSRLYVACANRGSVVEVDVRRGARLREWKVQNIPFEAKLSPDGTMIIVSNWAGRDPGPREEKADSDGVDVLVDRRGVASSGTVSLVELDTGRRKDLNVGLHPAGIVVRGKRAYVANAGSDTVSEIDIELQRVLRTFRTRKESRGLFGSMPNALALYQNRLFACCGGDNAVCEIDLRSGTVSGFRPAGFYPVGMQISSDGRTGFVVNTKGNGSVSFTSLGQPGNVHQTQGTVSVLDLTADIDNTTRVAATLARWNRISRPSEPDLAVYNGAIKHVLYIIKENRTYDSVFGDMRQGNGSRRLCTYGEMVTPNHHALAKEFGLFDNAYTSGMNSADGHQWAVEGVANDYIERFYPTYPRGYPFDGGDPMAYASSGFIWDAAVRKGLSVKVYGEFCKAALADINPRPKNWSEAWKDRASGANRIRVKARTTVAGLRGLIHPQLIGWPLLLSDQWRADVFVDDYQLLSRQDRVPNLMILTLPADHTEGFIPGYPTPRAMIADNDLALGRVVEAVSKSPQWKETCIFVMEDDAQYGFDHVDGHRAVCLVISPYSRRGVVDSTLYTQPSILRSIELMLGIDPMNRFDASATPFAACFSDRPEARIYGAVQNRVPLDELNRPLGELTGKRRYWAQKSMSLDWSDVDAADWKTLNRILWYDARGDAPYPVGGSTEEAD